MYSAAIALHLLAASIVSVDIPPRLETETRFKASAAYRSDSLDFDDNAKQYASYEGAWMFSPKSSFNYSLIRINSGEKESSTWNLILNDASDRYKFIAGDYYANFGAGLIIGKKSYFSSDIHSGGITESRMNPFTPCSSGNPRYAFRGIGISSALKRGDDPLTLNFFYSIRERYAAWDSYLSNETSSSPGTILGRYDPDPKNSEPVAVHDAGMMAEYQTRECVKIQLYCAGSFMKSSDGSEFLWNRRGIEGGSSAEKEFRTAGVFAEYADGYIDMFSELSYTSRTFITNGKETESSDFGSIGGFRFTHPVVKFSLTGKLTGEKFYSNYGSGSSGAERSINSMTKVRFTRRLWTGGEYSYQQALAYRIGSGIYPVKKRTRAFAEYNFSEHSTVESAAIRTEADTGKNISIYEKISGKYIHKFKKAALSFNVGAQFKNNSDKSYSFGGGAKWFPVKEFFIAGEYSHIIAAESNPLYSSTGRMGSISGGSNIKQVCETAALRAAYKADGINFSAGYMSVFTLEKTIEQKIEFSAGGEF